MSSVTIEDQHRVVPNQGIRRSVLNGLGLGLASAIIVGLSFLLSTLVVNLINEPSFGLNQVLIFGISVALLVGVLKGGLASFRHCVLRALLWRTGSVPWNYPRFLDYTAERILLRKVGGGYMFIHPLLLDYFAALQLTPISVDTPKRNALESIEEVGAERLQDTQHSLFAIAQMNLEDDDRAIVGKIYTVQAGVSQRIPENFRGVPFWVSVQNPVEPLSFGILIHPSENIELLGAHYQALHYNPSNAEAQFISCPFRLKAPGRGYLVINFYRERQWLQTMRFEFDGIEQSVLSTAINGG